MTPMTCYTLLIAPDDPGLDVDPTPFVATSDGAAVHAALAYVERHQSEFGAPVTFTVDLMEIGPYDPRSGLFGTSRPRRIFDSRTHATISERPGRARLVLTSGPAPDPCGCARCVELRTGLLTPAGQVAAERPSPLDLLDPDPRDDDHDECGGSCADVMRGRLARPSAHSHADC